MRMSRVVAVTALGLTLLAGCRNVSDGETPDSQVEPSESPTYDSDSEADMDGYGCH